MSEKETKVAKKRKKVKFALVCDKCGLDAYMEGVLEQGEVFEQVKPKKCPSCGSEQIETYLD